MPLSDNQMYKYLLTEASGTRNDTIGTNHLTDVNTVGTMAGPIGNAALFVSANSEVLTCADNAAISMGDTDMTICLFVYLNTGGNNQMGLVSRWGDGYEYRIWHDFSRFKFTCKGSNETTVTADTFGNVTTGVWYFVCCVHDKAADLIKISVNDGAFNTASHALGLNDSGATLRLGLHDGSYLNGALYNVEGWKRILSAGEITGVRAAGLVAAAAVPVFRHHLQQQGMG